MNKIAHAKAAPSQPLKRTSRDAEAELLHLESILTYLAGAHADARPLASGFTSEYWQARVGALESGHMLLAAQRVRLVALKAMADSLSAPSVVAVTDIRQFAA
ncbi:hypothetical protein BVER_04716c [Candidatus Burkholderia verschuerenii]|uniref:Uncharacterized protein n=1 Tax=Candidatus Burkholderia verschuerenii TaxID=242163 RepID=A0A0L0MC85_9BURK|nr:hypothetical protein [Candidatus Burkholderia verschuerenii]KND59958.1 hypothetical protein BVER_04716c [Candidatus Burkholderia verschuerenii]